MEIELLSVNQAAIVLKVHPLTIRRYITQGKIKAIKVGGNVRIHKNDLDSFYQSYTPATRVKVASGLKLTKTFAANDPIFRLKGRGVSGA